VSDSAGNAAIPKFRQIAIAAACPDSERWCVAEQACSFKGECGELASGLSQLLTAASLDTSQDEQGASSSDYLYEYDNADPSVNVVQYARDATAPSVRALPGQVWLRSSSCSM
jgi:hypothetical protein